MSKQVLVDELYKPIRKNFLRRKVIQKGINDTWQADLIVFNDYVKENKGFRYILTIIDIFSKKAWAVALKTKGGLEVTKAFQSILEKHRQKIKNLCTDAGTEFFNTHFQKLMKVHGINHYHTFTHLKASIVERFQRTFKQKLYKNMAYRGSHDWINHYQKVINEYNNTPHSTIGGLKPKNVSKRKEKMLLNTVYSSPKLYTKPKFDKGMYVRLSKYRKIFDKSYMINYTTEVFVVHDVHFSTPIVYSIRDLKGNLIKGKFYEQELQQVADKDVYLVENILKTKGNNLLVKWLGFSQPSWIPKENIL